MKPENKFPTHLLMQTTSAPERIYHVSEQPGIARFEPRTPPSPDAGVTHKVVWGISDRLLHNYLLPRDCPRVTFYAGSKPTAQDVAGFFSGTTARHVVAIEAAWLERVRSARLWLYEFPPASFSIADENAGYHVSPEAVSPVAVQEVSDLFAALTARDVELRVLPSLWKLRDAVLGSSLAFSFIRMRNATPREAASR